MATEVFNPDNLVIGEHPLESTNGIVTGGNFARGAVMGYITVDKKFTLSDDGASNGSEVPVAILAQDIDASGGDVVGALYVAGDFNEDKLTFGGAFTADNTRMDLFGRSIYLKTVV